VFPVKAVNERRDKRVVDVGNEGLSNLRRPERRLEELSVGQSCRREEEKKRARVRESKDGREYMVTRNGRRERDVDCLMRKDYLARGLSIRRLPLNGRRKGEEWHLGSPNALSLHFTSHLSLYPSLLKIGKTKM